MFLIQLLFAAKELGVAAGKDILQVMLVEVELREDLLLPIVS